ncbi:NADH-quinone oxidoreductase subunit 5 family protein [Litchfieldella rifensis]|uniref:NADH-quinone oxidoreductase subunit L n=1 Tax=Litchfieldella rifensis TaxID=762643 RepID=A0ABV7LTU1_9GAMM
MLWSVPLLPLLLAPLLYLSGRRIGRGGLTLGAVLVLLTTLALVGLAVAGEWNGSYRWSAALELTLGLSTAGKAFMLSVPLVALPIVVYAGYHERESRARLLALLVAFVGAMQLLVLANDLLTLLVAWELVGACSWALISHRWGEAEIPQEAARAFLITRFGDLGLYLAAAALFAGTGGFGYADLASLDGSLLHVAVAGIVLASAAKSAQVPFSMWLFAAMAGPVPASALLHAATMVAAGVYLLARLEPLLSSVAWFMPVAITVGLVTALAGGVVGVVQGQAKKLLAASTSAQYGLMWVAVGAGFPGVALVHFVTHAFMKAGLFLSVGLAERQIGSYSLHDMRLGRRMPAVALATGVASLALAGMVPLGAAWSKEQIVAAAGHQALWLTIPVMLAGALSALYATRFQLLAYGRSRRGEQGRGLESSAPSTPETWALYSLSAATLLFSLLWWPAVHQWLAVVAPLPASASWELFGSLALVLLGIAGGIRVTRGPAPLASGRFAWVASWWGLPTAIRYVTTAVAELSVYLARFDDRVLDAFAGAVVRGVSSASGRMARGDNDVVDAGLQGTARFGQWLAHLHATRGESISEGLPGTLARLTERGGQWARQAQSGQTHHYYTGIAAGFAIVLAILMIGALL